MAPLLPLVALLACSPDQDVLDDTSPPEDTAPDPRFDALAAALEADLAASHALGLSVAVLEDGSVTYARGFGTRRIGEEVPPTPLTLFQIGSTTKQMTAASLLRAVESRAVRLDDTLATVLPDLAFAQDPTWSEQVTLHHLLTHQGAFYDWLPWAATSDDAELADTTYGAFGDFIFLLADPGVFWNYSNPNFVLAGLVAEVSDTQGRMWPDLVREDLFLPLGMDRTYLRRSEVAADGDYADSWGYGLDGIASETLGEVPLDQVPDPAWARPAGLVWTTPTQMLAWADFLMDGDPDVLSDALRAELTREQVNTLYYGDTAWYGYGLLVERAFLTPDASFAVRVWEHGGNTLSFTSAFYVLPDQDFALSILASGYGVDLTRSVEAALTTLVDLGEAGPPYAFPFDPEALDAHVGDYSDPWNVGDVRIGRTGDVLTIKMPLLGAYGYDVASELVPLSTDVWYVLIDQVPYDLTFVDDDDEGPSHWIRNRVFVAERLDDQRQAAGTAPTRERVAQALARGRSAALAPPWAVGRP